MGFLTIVRKMRQKEKEMKVLLLGLDNAGKTTVVKKFNGEETDTISPTLGFDIKTMRHKGYSLNVWDVGGQQTIRSYWCVIFRLADSPHRIVDLRRRNYFEVDCADRWRLNICRDELHALMQQEQLGGASLLIFANKQDLPGAVAAEEIAKILELDSERFKDRHFRICACSATSGDGLLEGIDWLVDDIASRIMLT